MAIKRKDFQKLSSTVQEFLLKLPDEETSARLRDNLLQALHFLQLYYRVLQNREKNTDPLQWNIDHSLSPLTPFREAPDKFEWEWINVDSQKVRQSLPRNTAESFKALPLIIVAVKDGDFSSVKAIIKDDSNSIHDCDSFSRDSVTYAVQFDQFEILKFLLKHGANVNNPAADGSTSLHRAAYKENDQMLRLLLEYGAYVNAQDSYNRTAMHWSIRNKNTNCLKLLIEYDANINVKDRDGMSPAMWACHLDNIEHFKLLTAIYDNEHNNEIDCDNDGRTWLHWCVRKQDPLDCLNTLLNPKSALIRDKDGKTCLHVAAEQGALEACKLIIDVGGRNLVYEKDNKRQTPLHLATLNGHARSIKLLIEFGADPYVKDAAGASPIDYVTKRQLHFCSSIIEVCLRQNEKKRQGFESANSLNNEYNLTPQPPTTPKSSFSRQQPSPINTPTQSTTIPTFKENNSNFSNRPPRPLIRNSKKNENGNSIDPSVESIEMNNSNDGEQRHHKINGFHPIPPQTINLNNNNSNSNNNNNNNRLRPNGYRGGGWTMVERERDNIHSVSSDRIPSASLKFSRASSRTSFASEDLDKYMQPNNNNNNNNNNKPIPQPRLTPSNRQPSASYRILSGRSQDSSFPQIYDSTPPPPPPVKPRKGFSRSGSFQNYHDDEEILDNRHHNHNNHQINVEDVSDDENSVTSTKGEGYASEFSDSELKPGTHTKKHKNATSQDLTKRPSTPMDIRPDPQVSNQQQQQQQQQQQSHKNRHQNDRQLKYQHIGEQQVSYRFNEWDPFGKPSNDQHKQIQQNERQKSPLKQKTSAREQSPRQSSGRGTLTSASSTQNQDRLQNGDNGLDLMVSGQKFGRKESPTNTPRDTNAPIRPPTRRLQPIDRNSDSYTMSENEQISSPKQPKNPDMQKNKSKSSKSALLDRKKLEPIKNIQFGNIENEFENKNSLSQFIDDEQSISENTLSSDKQINMRVPKKNSAHQRQNYTGNKRRLIEALNTEESFKM